MLNELGKELEQVFEDLHFIGVQSGGISILDQCTFNCLKTGATICGNSPDIIQAKLEHVRINIKHLTK